MESRISATLAARTFSDVLGRVRYRGETFVVERGGEAVCRIVPAGARTCTVRDLAGVLGAVPHPDAGYLDAVEDAIRRQPKMPKSPWPR